MAADAACITDHLGWHSAHSRVQEHQHAWSQLQENLARTLEELYSIFKIDTHDDLLECTVRFLEQSVLNFKQLSTCDKNSNSASQVDEEIFRAHYVSSSTNWRTRSFQQLWPQQQQCQQHATHGSSPCSGEYCQALQRSASGGNLQMAEALCSAHANSSSLISTTDAISQGLVAATPLANAVANQSKCHYCGCLLGLQKPSQASRLSKRSTCVADVPNLQTEQGCSGPSHCNASITQYVQQQHIDTDSNSDTGSGAEVYSSCSTSSDSSSCGGSKSSSATTDSSPSAWQGAMNWGQDYAAISASQQNSTAACIHHKLSSPDRLRRTASQTRADAEERQARAERLRTAMVGERLARLKQEQLARQQRRAAEKEDGSGISAAASRCADKHQRSEALRAAHISRIRAKAGDETRKVEEVNFINALNNQGKKADLLQRMEEGEARRAEALAAILARQAGAAASIKEAAARRRAAEVERLAQLAEKQRRKQEAQAKIDEERRTAAAAREAAKEAARAAAQQREAERLQQAAWLRSKINARLKEAALRRLKHLELIRERAALGKDFERRDSFASSRSPSPPAVDATCTVKPSAGSSSGNGGGGKNEPNQLPHTARRMLDQDSKQHAGPYTAASNGSVGSRTAQASTAAPVAASKLNAAAPCFQPSSAITAGAPATDDSCFLGLQSTKSVSQPFPSRNQQLQQTAAPTKILRPNTPSTANSSSSNKPGTACSTRQGSPVPPASPSAAAPLPAEILQQLQGNSQSIEEASFTPASSLKTSKKGARRRMAKARRLLLESGNCYQDPEHVVLLGCTPEAQQILASWAPYLALLNVQPPSLRCQQAAVTARGENAMEGAVQPPGTHMQHISCSSTVTGDSPRWFGKRSSSSDGGSSLDGCTINSNLDEQQAAWNACSSPCTCRRRRSSNSGSGLGPQQAAGFGSPVSEASSPGAFSGRGPVLNRKEALAALVSSARALIAKQQLLVSHLARQTGLLHLLCKEVLIAAGGSTFNGRPSDSSGSGMQVSAEEISPITAGDGRTAAAVEARARQDKLLQARILALLGRLLDLPLNLDYLLMSGPLLPSFAKAALHALDHCNSLEADEPSMIIGGEASSRLSMLLQVLVAVLEHTPENTDVVKMQEELVGYMVSAGILPRLANVFSLFDQPMKDAARPVPPHVLQCLRLLRGLTAVRRPLNKLLAGKRWPMISPNAVAIVMDLQATAMAGVLSLLTAVLLNAAPTCTPADASCKALPPNFVEAANLVMAVLNNVCGLDLLAAQHMLSSTHNRLEFFHLISFLLSYCSSRWPAPGPTAAAQMQPAMPMHAPALAQPMQLQATTISNLKEQQQLQRSAVYSNNTLAESASGGTIAAAAVSSNNSCGSRPHCCGRGSKPQGAEVTRMHAAVAAVVRHPVAELLNQVLLLLGYFCVLAPSNQAMLQWGKSPNILQRLCTMPFQYFSVPELRAVALPTLLAVCYKADRSCDIVAQHVSLEMLLQYVQQERQRLSQTTHQQQQQHGQLQVPQEVQVLLQQLTSPLGQHHSPEVDQGSSAGGNSSTSQFSLTKRFPLELLDQAESYIAKQWQSRQEAPAVYS